MTVEFGPRDTVLTWAKKVAALDQCKNHRVIISTHEDLSAKDVRTTREMTWILIAAGEIEQASTNEVLAGIYLLLSALRGS